MNNFLGYEKRVEFGEVLKIENILSQIIFYIGLENKELKDKKPFMELASLIRSVSKQFDCEIEKMPKEELNKYFKTFKEKLNFILDFYEKNNISIFPIYINYRKSQTCTGFVFRIINKYSKFKFEPIYIDGDENESFQKKFYKFILDLEKNNILIEVKNQNQSMPGDLIVYCGDSEKEYSHVGLIYNQKFEVISKFGNSFLYLTPLDNQYFKGMVKVFKINDPKYLENFQNKFIPLINRIKMNKEQILELIENKFMNNK